MSYHVPMPLSPDEFFEHAMSATNGDGRMPLSRMTGWEIFPFESDGLRVVPLDAPVLPEPARSGEGGVDCQACESDNGVLWSDSRWTLKTTTAPTGAPLLLILGPKQHFDLRDLPDDMAAEMGRLVVHLARAIESLPHIARAHVSKWGDGGAHLHIFFFARPAGSSATSRTDFPLSSKSIARRRSTGSCPRLPILSSLIGDRS
jgi:diadenosine tetraphosphate (Ap4A) HIT family hydrolase